MEDFANSWTTEYGQLYLQLETGSAGIDGALLGIEHLTHRLGSLTAEEMVTALLRRVSDGISRFV